ncbi:MAG: arylsulfatase [Planctomycetota bacterium]
MTTNPYNAGTRGTAPLLRALLIVVALLCLGVEWSLAADRPNVLLVMTDDQGWGDVRSHGNDQIDTPTMDRLASQGARFDRFFVSPMCGPTRASLLTGRWNLRSGASWVSHGKEIMRLDEVTIADALAGAGYTTGCFGKWHNGEYGPYHPNDRGFQEFFGFCRGAWENYFDAEIERNRNPVQTNGYITDVLTDAVLEFIETNRQRPFFCYVPYNAPHHPFQVPEKYFSKYASRGLNEKTAAVYGMVENIDDNLARVLARLEELKLAENTIVIFTSDNGPAQPRYNGQMRGIKASVDEGGVRVPLFVRWPGHIQPGIEVKEIAAHIDLFPTIVELCGVPMPQTLPQDGRSLVPLLEGQTKDWPERMIFAHQNRLGETRMTPGSVRTQRYRLVNRDDKYELYDMIADPSQTRDIAADEPEVTQRLAAAYEAWYRDVTARGVDAPPMPVGYAAADVVSLQAEDAKLTGGLKFRRKDGWAHDSVLHWRTSDDSMTWTVDVLTPGRYEVTLMHGAAPAEVGATVHLEAGGSKVEAVVPRPHDPMPADERAHERNHLWTSGPVPIMTWVPLRFGQVTLDKGVTRLVVRATGLPADGAFETKEARVRRVE